MLFYFVQNNKIKTASKRNDTLYELGKSLNNKFMGHRVDDLLCININGDTTNLSSLIKKDKVLIFLFSELNCSSCYENQLNILQNFFPESQSQIVILGSFLSFRNFKIKMSNLPQKLPIYYVQHRAFDWEINDLGFPYFFILNSKLETSYFYIYNEEILEYNDQYFCGVKNLLSN